MKTEKDDLYITKLHHAMEIEEETTLLNVSCFDIGSPLIVIGVQLG